MPGQNKDANIGFTPKAEILNGRLAMIGFAALILTELITGQGVLHFWGII